MDRQASGKRPSFRPARAAPVAVDLSRGAVISTAREEIDRAGLAAFSLRGSARCPGVNASVAAWHTGSCDVVLAEMTAAVLRDAVPAREGDQAWPKYLGAQPEIYATKCKVGPFPAILSSVAEPIAASFVESVVDEIIA